MDPISIGVIILTTLATKAIIFAVIVVIFLTFEVIFNWFRDREKKIVSNPDVVPVTAIPNDVKKGKELEKQIAEAIDKGDLPVVGGVFNKKTGKLEEAVVFQSKDVNKDVLEKHKKHGVVIYN